MFALASFCFPFTQNNFQMKHLFTLLLIGLTISPLILSSQNRAEYAPNEIIIKFTDGTTKELRQRVMNEMMAVEKQEFTSIKAYHWAIPETVTLNNSKTIKGVKEMQAHLERLPYVLYAEPNYLYYLSAVPNDPQYGNLWGMSRIQAPLAWDIETGSNTVVVGIIDTGVDWTHPDLVDNIWQNLGEDVDGDGHVLEYIGGQWVFDPGDINGIDDDGNGYADDFVGWDFRNNDNNPYDGHSHGTHVAGTVAATGNNGIGVTGVCWTANIMALKFLSTSGFGYTSDAILALQYAIDNNASITNNSWGGGPYSLALDNMISLAEANDQLFVAAAGNYTRDNDAIPFFPSSYPHDNIISVAATNSSGELASFSHYGQTSVDVAAPGKSILSTTPGGNYAYNSGTSMATPHVAGLAALIKSQCNDFTYAEIKDRIMNAVEVVGFGYTDYGFPWQVGDMVPGVNLTGNFISMDDDQFGNGINGIATFSTPPISIVGETGITLSFDYSFNAIGGDSFGVEVSDGINTSNVLSLTTDATALANIDIDALGFTGSAITVTFIYDDGGVWAWGVGVDNISLDAASGNLFSEDFENGLPIANLVGKCVSGGRINAYNAVNNPTCCPVEANFTLNTADLCACSTLSFNNTSINSTHYVWDFGDGSYSIFAEPEHAYCNAGTYNVLLLASDGDCYDSYQQTLIIKPRPDSSFTYAINNQFVDFFANDTTAGNTYDWTVNGSSFASIPNPSYTFGGTGIYEVCLTVGSGCGASTYCEDIEIATICGVSTPEIGWEYCYGGTGSDKAGAIIQTSDGGFMVVGIGDIPGDNIYWDLWAVKLNAQGLMEWQTQLLGGMATDGAHSVQQTHDGGYLISGYSNSSDRDLTNNHGGSDCWLIKLNGTGDLVWQKSLGGSEDDSAYAAYQISDGYIVVGFAYSNDQNVSGNHGGADVWVVKLDQSRSIVWQKCLGGSGDDKAYAMQITPDGGYLIAGETASNNGNVGVNYGGKDFWVIKLNASGQIVWEETYGGSGDDMAHAIQLTTDGGFIVAGHSASNGGMVGGNNGEYDFWAVKVDAARQMEWQRNLGGSLRDQAYSVRQTADGGYVMAGLTISNDGDVSGFHGAWDYWVTKLSDTGYLQWEQALGGTEIDVAYDIVQSPDGSYIVAGFAGSNNGDISYNNGGSDFWVVKLDPEVILEADFTAALLCQYEQASFSNTSTGATSYEWFVNSISMSTDTDFTHVFLQTGTYVITLIATDNDGCSDTYSEIIEITDCVYPGDINRDGIVDIFDYLGFTLALGEVGPSRSDQSIGFYAHPADDWLSFFSGNLFHGINHKHADGNGNGIVDLDDTNAISANWGMTSPYYTPLSLSSIPEATLTSVANVGALQEGQTIGIDINVSNGLDNGINGTYIYGMVFGFTYSGTFQGIDAGQSCLGSNLLLEYEVDTSLNKVIVAISRTDRQEVYCDGSLANISILIDEVPTGSNICPIEIDNNTNIFTNAAGDYFLALGECMESMNVYSALEAPPVIIRANAILEGAYVMGEHSILGGNQFMHTNLHAKGILPLAQPFNAAPWLYNGSEAYASLENMPSNAVDWVLLEIRDPNTWNIVEQKAAMLLSDGSMVDVDGNTNGVKFDNIGNGQAYHLIIRSRNHLAVMSATTISPQNHLAVYDFTQSANQTAGTNQLTEVETDIYAMRVGDFNADGVISVADYNDFQSTMSSMNDYLPTDGNMDGAVTVEDLNGYTPNASKIGITIVRY